MLVGDEFEIDRVHNGPDLPTALDRREQVRLNLLANRRKTVAIDQTQVGEKDRHCKRERMVR